MARAALLVFSWRAAAIVTRTRKSSDERVASRRTLDFGAFTTGEDTAAGYVEGSFASSTPCAEIMGNAEPWEEWLEEMAGDGDARLTGCVTQDEERRLSTKAPKLRADARALQGSAQPTSYVTWQIEVKDTSTNAVVEAMASYDTQQANALLAKYSGPHYTIERNIVYTFPPSDCDTRCAGSWKEVATAGIAPTLPNPGYDFSQEDPGCFKISAGVPLAHTTFWVPKRGGSCIYATTYVGIMVASSGNVIKFSNALQGHAYLYAGGNSVTVEPAHGGGSVVSYGATNDITVKGPNAHITVVVDPLTKAGEKFLKDHLNIDIVYAPGATSIATKDGGAVTIAQDDGVGTTCDGTAVACPCEDSACGEAYVDPNGIKHSCAWLAATNDVATRCSGASASAVSARTYCPSTCDNAGVDACYECTPSCSSSKGLSYKTTPLPLCCGSQLGLDIDGEAADDAIGRALAMNAAGDVVATYARKSASSPSVVRVWRLNCDIRSALFPCVGNDWVRMGLDDVSGSPDSPLGVALNAAGDRLAVGDPSYNNEAGRVTIYRWETVHVVTPFWTILGFNTIDGTAPGQKVGSVIAMNGYGNRVAVGEPTWSQLIGGSWSQDGRVRVFEQTNHPQYFYPMWAQLGLDIPGPTASWLGGSLDMNLLGDRLVAGAVVRDLSFPPGLVMTYYLDTTDPLAPRWMELGNPPIREGSGTVDFFGTAVAMSDSGHRVAVGAPAFSNSAGHVDVWELDQTPGLGWTTITRPIVGTGSETLGTSVSLNCDGTRLAFGVIGFTGADGPDTGQTRVVDLDGVGGWVPVESIDGEASGDRSHLVQLSQDGSRVVTSSDQNSGSGLSGAGHIRVFDLCLSVPCGKQPIGLNINGHTANARLGDTIAMNYAGGGLDMVATYEKSISSPSVVKVWRLNAANLWERQGLDIVGSDDSRLSISFNLWTNEIAVGDPKYNNAAGRVMTFVTACQQVGCIPQNWDPFPTSGANIIEGKVAGGEFGYAVALNNEGRRLVVGEPYWDPGAPPGQTSGWTGGGVSVWEAKGGTWKPHVDFHYLKGPAGSRLGRVVAINGLGDKLVAGGDTAVMVFHYVDSPPISEWQTLGGPAVDGSGSWTATTTAPSWWSSQGESLAMSYDGLRVAVGVPSHSNDAGRVSVYEYAGTGAAGTWTRIFRLDGTLQSGSHMWVGDSVALNGAGTRLAFSSPYFDTPQGTDTGRTRVFDFRRDGWVEVESIDGDAFEDQSGAVAMTSDGSRVAIGAAWKDVSGVIDSGLIRVYDICP